MRSLLPAAAALGAALASACATRPVPVTAPAPPRAPLPAPTSAPTPVAAAIPAFREVPEPRLDVSLAVDRASFALPPGDWLLRSGGTVRRVLGALEVRPGAAPSAAPPRFQVQAGSFASAEAARVEAGRLSALLGLPTDVAGAGGRFSVRVGEGGERAALDPILDRVRRDAVPDAFLVGLAAPGEPARALVVKGPDGTGEVASPLELTAVDGALLPANGSLWRGNLLAVATPRGTLHVVNRVGLEDYLLGVVPLEMGPRVYDELEALKAQAVAARTYAVKRRGDFAAEGYDLCATPRCQVYGGASAEQPLSSEAVRATAGQVLLWDGAPADALFTSTCGGRTEDAGNVFPSYTAGAFPYLVSVPCRGEERLPVATSSRPPAHVPAIGTLALRGRAFLHAAGRRGAAWADLKAARALLTSRLGLPPGAPPKRLAPEAVYADLDELLGDASLLTEEAERRAAPAGWSEAARRVLAALTRFQVAGPAPLPTERPFAPEEAAGLWASILLRTGGLEELDGRLVAAPPGKLVLKTPKGREERTLPPDALLFRGGGEAWTQKGDLSPAPGDRVRLLSRDGTVAAVAASASSAEGLYERESAWIHWVRRFGGAELMGKLRERDGTREGSVVKGVEVLARGRSGRASKVRVTTDRGAFTLAGLEIRFALSLPESLFTLVTGRDEKGEPVHTFFGRGWGHGVGLCQNGTFGMALAGKSHAEILAAYYPGTTLGPWPPAAPALVSTASPEPGPPPGGDGAPGRAR